MNRFFITGVDIEANDIRSLRVTLNATGPFDLYSLNQLMGVMVEIQPTADQISRPAKKRYHYQNEGLDYYVPCLDARCDRPHALADDTEVTP